MKAFFVTVAALLLIVGCKETVTKEPILAGNVNVVRSGSVNLEKLGNVVVDEHAKYYGVWEGLIGNDTAAVVMTSLIKIIRIEDGKVRAHATVGGKEMNISGVQQTKDGKFCIRLCKGSGTRERTIFEIQEQEVETFTGTYFEKTGEPGSKVVLTHRVFKYDPNVMLQRSNAVDWENPKKIKKSYTDDNGKKHTYEKEANRYTSDSIPPLNASAQKLTEGQLKNLRKIDLEVIRNTVYARHGFAFSRAYLRNLFDRAEWYVPIADNVDKDLTPLEKENIALLTRLEKYATDHYEYFGR